MTGSRASRATSPGPSQAAWANAAPRLVRMPGLSDYAQTLAAMREFTLTRTEERRDEIWLLEHPPVFTLGLAGRREHVLGAGEIPVVETERGGQVTYHGPGQVIAYTLLDLRRLGIGPRELVFRIEQSVIQALAHYGIEARRVCGAPGVYVPIDHRADGPSDATGEEPRDARFAGLAKIAALGVKISRGCSFHGVALNVAMDLAPFARIDPCGYAGLRAADMASLGVDAPFDEVAARLGERLAAHLGGAGGAGGAGGTGGTGG